MSLQWAAKCWDVRELSVVVPMGLGGPVDDVTPAPPIREGVGRCEGDMQGI